MAMFLDPLIDNSFLVLRPPARETPANFGYSLPPTEAASQLRQLRKQAKEWVVEAARALNKGTNAAPVPEATPGCGVRDEEDEAVLAAMFGVAARADGESASAPSQGHAIQLDGVSEEASSLNDEFSYAEARQKGRAHSMEAVRSKWEGDGGWEGTQRCPELYWWYLNSTRYSRLGELAKRLFVVQAASAGGERLFSRTGRLCSPLRSRLSGRSINELQMIADHYHEGLLCVAGYSTERANKRDASGKSKATSTKDSEKEGQLEVQVVRSQRKLKPKVKPAAVAAKGRSGHDDGAAVLEGMEGWAQANVRHAVSDALAHASWAAYYSAWHYDTLHSMQTWQVAQQATMYYHQAERTLEVPTEIVEV
jgi:hypothetical protein